MESNKVKLPKEVAEAIERLFQDGWTAPMILRQSIRGRLDLEENQILCNWAEDEWKCEQLAKALVTGFEVEQTPQEPLSGKELWRIERHVANRMEQSEFVAMKVVHAETLIAEVKRLQAIETQNVELKKLSEHASRIIDSGMYGGASRYDPLSWFKTYHKLVNGVDTNETN